MDFFNKEDMSCLMNLDGRKAKYQQRPRPLLASYRDRVRDLANKIVHELYIRNFDVAGFDCEFVFERKDATVYVREVSHDGLRFTGSTLRFGKHRVNLYEDNSGSVEVFVGDPEDLREFDRGFLHNRRMNGKKKIHLSYGRSYGLGPDFEHNRDSRDHMPEGDEPMSVNVLAIQSEAIPVLESALSEVQRHPVPEQFDVFKEPEPVPVNCAHLPGVLYGFKVSRHESEPGLIPNHRLISLSSAKPEHQYRSYMNDGFVYMETEFKTAPDHSVWYNYAMGSWGDPVEVYEVNLSRANGIYVIDGSVFEKRRSDYWADNPVESVEYMTDELVAEFRKEEAATMVHINDYDGSFEKPLVISRRYISPAEIKMVSNKKLDFYLNRKK